MRRLGLWFAFVLGGGTALAAPDYRIVYPALVGATTTPAATAVLDRHFEGRDAAIDLEDFFLALQPRHLEALSPEARAVLFARVPLQTLMLYSNERTVPEQRSAVVRTREYLSTTVARELAEHCARRGLRLVRETVAAAAPELAREEEWDELAPARLVAAMQRLGGIVEALYVYRFPITRPLATDLASTLREVLEAIRVAPYTASWQPLHHTTANLLYRYLLLVETGNHDRGAAGGALAAPMADVARFLFHLRGEAARWLLSLVAGEGVTTLTVRLLEQAARYRESDSAENGPLANRQGFATIPNGLGRTGVNTFADTSFLLAMMAEMVDASPADFAGFRRAMGNGVPERIQWDHAASQRAVYVNNGDLVGDLRLLVPQHGRLPAPGRIFERICEPLPTNRRTFLTEAWAMNEAERTRSVTCPARPEPGPVHLTIELVDPGGRLAAQVHEEAGLATLWVPLDIVVPWQDDQDEEDARARRLAAPLPAEERHRGRDLKYWILTRLEIEHAPGVWAEFQGAEGRLYWFLPWNERLPPRIAGASQPFGIVTRFLPGVEHETRIEVGAGRLARLRDFVAETSVRDASELVMWATNGTPSEQLHRAVYGRHPTNPWYRSCSARIASGAIP